MQAFLKRFLLFIFLMVLFYPFFILFCGCFVPQLFRPNINYQLGSYGHMNSRIKEIKSLPSGIDILFLGSSHAYRGFDTRNFNGLKTFNLGSSSQTPIQTNTLLKRYLNKLKPKAIVYEVYPETLSSDGAEATLDLLSNDSQDVNSILMALKVNNIKVYNTLLYGTFVDWFGINRTFTESYKKGKDLYIPGGYVERELSCFMFIKAKKSQLAQFNPVQLKVFGENIEMISEKGIKLILVYAPITRALYNSYHNNNYVDSTMNSYGVTYYNFNNIISLNDSVDFYDAHHLNQVGVNKFNSKLLEMLQLSDAQ